MNADYEKLFNEIGKLQKLRKQAVKENIIFECLLEL